MDDGTESSGYGNESRPERMHPERSDGTRNHCGTPERSEDYTVDPVTSRRDWHFVNLRGGLTDRA